jgi:2-polyprenyl-3-methyl-5-hydroxy-6-metoxy-1,4-benzoquinol methylase
MNMNERMYADKDLGYFANMRFELTKFIPDDVKKILDVGCASGNFGAFLKTRKEYEIWGVEPNQQSAEKAKSKLDKVIVSLFTPGMTELNGQKFDLVCFNDVLEHLVSPEEALTASKSFLNDNGYILASIPNVRYYRVILSLLRDKDFKYQKFGVMDETHLRFFTKKSMIRLFEANNYKVLAIEGINDDKLPWFKSFLLSFQSDMKYPQFAMLCKLKDEIKVHSPS